MKKTVILISLFMAMCYSICISFAYDSPITTFEVNSVVSENIKKIQIDQKHAIYSKKDAKYVKDDSENYKDQIIAEYNLDEVSFESSESTIIQIQTMNIGPGFEFEDDPGSGNTIVNEDTWEGNDNDPFLEITTVAYYNGITPNRNKIYRVTAEVTYLQQFVNYGQDHLIIRHGENGSFYNYSSDQMEGEHIAHAIFDSLYPQYLPDVDEIRTTSIEPDYSSLNGVDYAFSLVNKSIANLGNPYNCQDSYDISVSGNYYFIGTNDTVVQAVYIHNKQLFDNNLSVSIGYYGVGGGISIEGTNEAFYAEPVTLLF